MISGWRIDFFFSYFWQKYDHFPCCLVIDTNHVPSLSVKEKFWKERYFWYKGSFTQTLPGAVLVMALIILEHFYNFNLYISWIFLLLVLGNSLQIFSVADALCLLLELNHTSTLWAWFWSTWMKDRDTEEGWVTQGWNLLEWAGMVLGGRHLPSGNSRCFTVRAGASRPEQILNTPVPPFQ